MLTKLNSDDRNGTENFTNKFISKIETIFANLPKPVEWQSFYINDFRPLVINLHPEVAQAHGAKSFPHGGVGSRSAFKFLKAESEFPQASGGE